MSYKDSTFNDNCYHFHQVDLFCTVFLENSYFKKVNYHTLKRILRGQYHSRSKSLSITFVCDKTSQATNNSSKKNVWNLGQEWSVCMALKNNPGLRSLSFQWLLLNYSTWWNYRENECLLLHNIQNCNISYSKVTISLKHGWKYISV